MKFILTFILVLLLASCAIGADVVVSEYVIGNTGTSYTFIGKPRPSFDYTDDGRVVFMMAYFSSVIDNVWISSDSGTTWTTEYQSGVTTNYHLHIGIKGDTLYVCTNDQQGPIRVIRLLVNGSNEVDIIDTVETSIPSESMVIGGIVPLGGDSLILVARANDGGSVDMNPSSAISTNAGTPSFSWNWTPLASYNDQIRFGVSPGWGNYDAWAVWANNTASAYYAHYFDGSDWSDNGDPYYTIQTGISNGYRNFSLTIGRDSAFHAAYVDETTPNSHLMLATLLQDSMTTGGWIIDTIHTADGQMGPGDRLNIRVALCFSWFDQCLRVIYDTEGASNREIRCIKYDYDNLQMATDTLIVSDSYEYVSSLAGAFPTPSSLGSMTCVAFEAWDGDGDDNPDDDNRIKRLVTIRDSTAIEYTGGEEEESTTSLRGVRLKRVIQ